MDPDYVPRPLVVTYGPRTFGPRTFGDRVYLVVIHQGRYTAGILDRAKNANSAKREVWDVVENGGCVWNTYDGELPEDTQDLAPSISSCTEVTGWEKDRVQAALEQYQIIGEVMVG